MSKYLQIVLNIPLNQSFTYLNLEESGEKSLFGFRVDINFGNRKTRGVIIDEFDTLPENLGFEPEKIRKIHKIIDEEPVLTEEIYDLAKFVSKYYLCSLGEAIFAMLPGGKRETDFGGFSFVDEISDKKEKILSEEQKEAVKNIIHSSNAENGQLFNYLYGPTGTGKTEVFLQASEQLLKQGKGVIYLVPEIGLTAQVIEAVVSRFGNTAAVLHSELTPSQKLKEWHRILKKEARVVIGARSAVFAPVPDLGMIIIDEEHDGSYKSGNTPRYHARQVAMYRCTKLKIPLLMGSATPSVEAWNSMKEGKIVKHTLTKRLAGGAMPKISCIDLSAFPSDTGSISPTLEKEINQTLAEKRQSILFLNRRGFTHFFKCHSCGFEQKCKNCSVSMTFHKAEKRLRCHYCGWSISPPQKCPECGSLDVGYSGFGTEFIEAEVKQKFPAAKIVRIDTDSLSHKGELQEKLDAFKNGEYDIMLGTQMVAKGLNFPNLKLVGVILADTGLHLPDFRAAERTFALITQVAGRAGRFFPDGKVFVQTYSPESEPIAFSVHGKIKDFYDSEIGIRQLLNFPPFSRLLRIVFRSPSEEHAASAAEEAAVLITRILNSIKSTLSGLQLKNAEHTEILGPSECPLAKIATNFRHQILLRGPSITILQAMAQKFLYGYKTPGDIYVEYDVDPVALL